MKSLVKMYDRLTAQERFRLMLEALARDDESEADRLAGTCPLEVYKMSDVDFTDLLEGSHKMVLVFNCLWSEAYYGYLMAEQALIYRLDYIQGAIKFYVKGANNVWNLFNDGIPPFDLEGKEPTEGQMEEIAFVGALEGIPKPLLDDYYSAVGHVKGVYEGFIQYCNQLSISPETLVMSWFAPLMDQLKKAEALSEGEIALNEESKEITLKVLSRYLNEEKMGQGRLYGDMGKI